ncbi:MAG: peptide ABC transporter substrate-binding protein [Herpetosiphonaceae bacterium]|nr:peptide ABC transporter substrate-binding protein [Herpetosiphonaceae bacterium]
MARRIRWQIGAALLCGGLILLLLGHLALSTAAQGDPSAGGTYREALVGQVLDFNPLRGIQQTPAEADLSALLFEGLTRVETTGVVAPDLAIRWTLSDSQTTYTVTLRPDVLWHDGAPFTSADVVWTTDWLKSAEFNGDPGLAAPWQSIAVTALDPHTIRFDLPTPFAPFLTQLALPILPSHLLRDAGPSQWAAWSQNPVGTGVYRLSALTTTEVELTVNSAYRVGDEQTALPNLQTLVFRLYPNLDEAHLALRRGAVDALAYNLTQLGELPLPAGYTQVQAPLGDYTVLTFNLREAPLDDVRMRQAISYAVNQPALVDTALAGHGVALTTPILPSSWAWADDLTPYVDDASHSRANALLDDLNWPRDASGFRRKAGQLLRFTLITSDAPDRIAVARAIETQLATVGISTTIQPLSTTSLQQQLNNREFTLALHGWANLGSDPDVYELWHSSQVGEANFAGLEDPELDELLVRGRQTSDLESRRALYHDFQVRWLRLAPSVILYQPLLEQQTRSAIQVLGLSPQASQSEVLYRHSDRFRRLTNWYQVTTIQVLPNLRRNPSIQRPR